MKVHVARSASFLRMTAHSPKLSLHALLLAEPANGKEVDVHQLGMETPESLGWDPLAG